MCVQSKREIALYLKSQTVESASGCWEWQGKLHKGYAKVARSIHPSRAGHRAMYDAAIEPIPNGLCVLHECDNPKCINPSHLWVGTNQDNQKDKVSKGRATGGSMPNETNPWHKFSKAEVEQMRLTRKTFVGTNKQLAKMFGVSEGHFSHIINKRVRVIGMADAA